MARTQKDMGGKKEAGQARKANAAAEKNAKKAADQEAEDAKKWEKGAKNNSKKEAEAAKKAEAARKKAEKEALQREDDASLPKSKARGNGKPAPTAAKKTRGLNLDQIDSLESSATPLSTLNATGIDSALDALTLANEASNEIKIELHPERRYPRALKAYMERRLLEMQNSGEGAGLRKQQREERIVKEFEKSPENPFNQVTGAYNATRDDMREMRTSEKQRMEKHLTK
ncbi:hypothetical protein BROUX41_001521 [Berkeleyomyces rouxiae]|uniref:uncharacterized protein n=1 Tax=Berkeleyomyces rouxiae TaxID=2035830 RepID=UPI003B7FBB57